MLVIFDRIHCVLNFACIWLNNCSIDFDQTSVKSRSVYSLLKFLKKVTELPGLNFRKGSICKLHF